MCSCFQAKPLSSKRNQLCKKEVTSLSLSTQIKDAMVQVVFVGGRVELYRSPIPVTWLTQKYRGSCVTTPDVFKHPHESLLSNDDVLLPGHKYLVMSSNAVERLKHRHSGRGRRTTETAYCDEPMLISEEVSDAGDTRLEESICSASEFYVSKKSLSEVLRRQSKEKRQFVPPIQRRKVMKEPGWEPSLTSIQEVSP